MQPCFEGIIAIGVLVVRLVPDNGDPLVIGFPDSSADLTHRGRDVKEGVWPVGVTYNKGTSVLVVDVATLKACGCVEVNRLDRVACGFNLESFGELFPVFGSVCTDDSAFLGFQPSVLDHFDNASNRVEEHVVVGSNAIGDPVLAEHCGNLDGGRRLYPVRFDLLYVRSWNDPLVQAKHLVESVLVFDRSG